MGTPGHMNHPFDVDWVNTGEDLTDFFISAGELLQTKPASIKWDGINVSFKLVTDGDGRKGFRMDRGTSAPESVIGMTAEDAYNKWPEGHGMPVAIEKLLSIFNEALPKIVPELKALGMWDDSTKFFNTEYMEEGGTNVVKYDRNMLAIHGINQFYEKKAQAHRIRKGIGMDRPGMERPTSPDTGKPIKNVSVETDYDRNALNSLIAKVHPMAAKFDFLILGDTPTENVSPIDLEVVLDTNFPIHLTSDNVETHSIRDWLQDSVNPRDKKIATKQGKTPGALSKEIYVAVLNKTPLVDLLESQEDVEWAINGAVFYHATKELGNAVKKSLKVKGWEGPLADVAVHEGIVLRDPKFGPKPVKITGEFILEGMVSSFGSEERQELGKQADVDAQAEKTKLALLAGGFKPPHKGHLEMVKFYNQQVGPDGKVIILLGSGGKAPRTINGRTITSQDSMEIWDVYLKNEPSIPWPSGKIEFQNVEGAGPIAPIIDYVRELAPEDQIILLGAGEKDEDRWPNLMADPRNNPRGLEIETTPAPNIVDDNGNPLSARIMRDAVENGDFETFKSYIPNSSMQAAEKIFTTLGGGTIEEPQEEPQEQLQEVNPLPLGIFLRLIEEELNKKTLNELETQASAWTPDRTPDRADTNRAGPGALLGAIGQTVEPHVSRVGRDVANAVVPDKSAGQRWRGPAEGAGIEHAYSARQHEDALQSDLGDIGLALYDMMALGAPGLFRRGATALARTGARSTVPKATAQTAHAAASNVVPRVATTPSPTTAAAAGSTTLSTKAGQELKLVGDPFEVGGRAVQIVEMPDGRRTAFYQSSGRNTPEITPKDTWVPYGGHGGAGWYVKLPERHRQAALGANVGSRRAKVPAPESLYGQTSEALGTHFKNNPISNIADVVPATAGPTTDPIYAVWANRRLAQERALKPAWIHQKQLHPADAQFQGFLPDPDSRFAGRTHEQSGWPTLTGEDETARYLELSDWFENNARWRYPRDPRDKILDEGKLSSDQFLQLVEQILNEEPRMTSWQGPPLADQSTLRRSGGWNEEAQENMEKNDPNPGEQIKHVAEGEEEELEEMSSMAGGNVEGSPGGAWGKDFTSENEAEAQKSHTLEEEELVENIVNYLNNGVGVL